MVAVSSKDSRSCKHLAWRAETSQRPQRLQQLHSPAPHCLLPPTPSLTSYKSDQNASYINCHPYRLHRGQQPTSVLDDVRMLESFDRAGHIATPIEAMTNSIFESSLVERATSEDTLSMPTANSSGEPELRSICRWEETIWLRATELSPATGARFRWDDASRMWCCIEPLALAFFYCTARSLARLVSSAAIDG